MNSIESFSVWILEKSVAVNMITGIPSRSKEAWSLLDPTGDDVGGNVFDVTLTDRECVDFGLIDVEAEAAESSRGECVDQRQADVPQADHTDDGRLPGDFLFQTIYHADRFLCEPPQ